MAEAALALESSMAPKLVKVSSKRQITIPAEMFKRAGNPRYAYIEWHDDGSMSIDPIPMRNEEAGVAILRSLVERGLEGDELISEYGKAMSHIIDFNAAIRESLADEAAGREAPFSELRDEIEARYGL